MLANNFRWREVNTLDISYSRLFIMEKRKSERYSVDPDSTIRDIYQVGFSIIWEDTFDKSKFWLCKWTII